MHSIPALFQKTMRIVCSLGVAAAALVSCSSTEVNPVADIGTPETMYSADLFTCRRFLTGAGYELFSFRDNELYVECGTIAGLNPKHKKMIGVGDRNLIAQERQRIALEDWELEELRPLITALVDSKPASEIELPSPGTLGTLTGTGIFEARIRRGYTEKYYVTSFDAIAELETMPLAGIKRLFTKLRVPASPLCGRVTFGGVR